MVKSEYLIFAAQLFCMSALFEQKALKEFANIRKELADLKLGLADTKKAVEVNREQIVFNTQKLVSHDEQFMHMDIVIMDIRTLLQNHERQFAYLREGQQNILNIIDGFFGELKRQSTEITALGSARERHEGRIERLETHVGLVR